MHKLNNNRRCSKCFPECSTQSCKCDNQEAAVLLIVSREILLQASVKLHFNESLSTVSQQWFCK